MAISVVALIVTALSVVIPMVMVMIAATWKLSQRINEVRTEISDGRSIERQWVTQEIRYHQETCRAAQDVITGVRKHPLAGSE